MTFFDPLSATSITHIHTCVTCSGHPSKCWPRSLQLNSRDQDKHNAASPEKLALWKGSISSLLYCPPHFPHLREASPRSLTWVLSGCLAPAQQRHPPFMTTTTVVSGRNHVRTWVNPHLILAKKAQSSTEALPETGLHQTPESLRCHHSLRVVAVTHPGADHARRCLTFVIKRNTLPHQQKS
jgi:hypothetical protein